MLGANDDLSVLVLFIIDYTTRTSNSLVLHYFESPVETLWQSGVTDTSVLQINISGSVHRSLPSICESCKDRRVALKERKLKLDINDDDRNRQLE